MEELPKPSKMGNHVYMFVYYRAVRMMLPGFINEFFLQRPCASGGVARHSIFT